MSEKKVWFITGAGRGMGVEIAKAALAAGNAVVATGRSTDAVREALGEARVRSGNHFVDRADDDLGEEALLVGEVLI